jgi:hypothetical protein
MKYFTSDEPGRKWELLFIGGDHPGLGADYSVARCEAATIETGDHSSSTDVKCESVICKE